MYIFWNNIFQFIRFFISVLLGFFLTISSTFFELLRGPKEVIAAIIISSMLMTALVTVFKLMLAVN